MYELYVPYQNITYGGVSDDSYWLYTLYIWVTLKTGQMVWDGKLNQSAL